MLYEFPYDATARGDLYFHLNKLVKGESELEERLKEVGIGYYWNMYRYYQRSTSGHNPYADEIAGKYIALETPAFIGNETCIYSVDGRYYLEVCKLYRWLSSDPEPEELSEYVTFEGFTANYPSSIKLVLQHDRVIEWMRTIESIVDFDLW